MGETLLIIETSQVRSLLPKSKSEGPFASKTMNRWSVTLILAVIHVISIAHSQSEEQGKENAGATARVRFEKADAELNAVYGELLQQLTLSEQQQLRQEQRLWLKSRDAATASPKTNLKGSVRPDDIEKLTVITEHRVRELGQRLQASFDRRVREAKQGNPTTEALAKNRFEKSDARLNAVYRQLIDSLTGSEQRQLRDEQRAWIRSRDAAGESYSKQSPGTSAAAARLEGAALATEKRVVELENRLGIRERGETDIPIEGTRATVATTTSEQLENGASSGNAGPSGVYVGEMAFSDGTNRVELELAITPPADGRRTAAAEASATMRVIPAKGRAPYTLALVGFYQEHVKKIQLRPRERLTQNNVSLYPTMLGNGWELYHNDLDHELTGHIQLVKRESRGHGQSNWASLSRQSYTLVRKDEAARRQASQKAKPESRDVETFRMDPTNIVGVYIGQYVADQALMNIEMKVDSPIDHKTLDVVFSYFAPGGSAEHPLGTVRLKGQYDPDRNLLALQADKRFQLVGSQYLNGLTATFDGSSGNIKGSFKPTNATFEVARDSERTAKQQTASSVRAQRRDDAPTSIWEARGDEERCLTILRWTRRLEQEYPEIDSQKAGDAKVVPKAINLFSDECFVPVFGKPFEQMDKSERTRISHILRDSFRHPAFKQQFTWQRSYLAGPFSQEVGGGMTQSNVASSVAFRRLKRQELKKSIAELQNLPNNLEAYERAASLWNAEGNVESKEVDLLWPSERKAFQEAVVDAKKRTADSALVTLLDRAMTKASSYEDLCALQETISANAELFELASAPVRDLQKGRVDERIRTELKALMETERKAVDGFGGGATALVNGTVWYDAFNKKYGGKFQGSEVNEVLEYFGRRRELDLKAAEAVILDEINHAESKEALDTVLARNLGVPTDSRDVVGRRLRLAADERLRTIAWESEKAKYSERELALMSTPGVVDVPPDYPEPTEREIGLAVLRAFAQHGKFLDPDTVAYNPNPLINAFFNNAFTITLTLRETQIATVEKKPNGSYLCTCRVFIAMRYPQLEAMAAPQARLMTNLTRMADMEEPGWLQITLELTRTGWRSPDFEQAVGMNSIESLFR